MYRILKNLASHQGDVIYLDGSPPSIRYLYRIAQHKHDINVLDSSSFILRSEHRLSVNFWICFGRCNEKFVYQEILTFHNFVLVVIKLPGIEAFIFLEYVEDIVVFKR